MEMNCQGCGMELEQGYDVCSFCGRHVDESGPAPLPPEDEAVREVTTEEPPLMPETPDFPDTSSLETFAPFISEDEAIARALEKFLTVGKEEALPAEVLPGDGLLEALTLPESSTPTLEAGETVEAAVGQEEAEQAVTGAEAENDMKPRQHSSLPIRDAVLPATPVNVSEAFSSPTLTFKDEDEPRQHSSLPVRDTVLPSAPIFMPGVFSSPMPEPAEAAATLEPEAPEPVEIAEAPAVEAEPAVEEAAMEESAVTVEVGAPAVEKEPTASVEVPAVEEVENFFFAPEPAEAAATLEPEAPEPVEIAEAPAVEAEPAVEEAARVEASAAAEMEAVAAELAVAEAVVEPAAAAAPAPEAEVEPPEAVEAAEAPAVEAEPAVEEAAGVEASAAAVEEADSFDLLMAAEASESSAQSLFVAPQAAGPAEAKAPDAEKPAASGAAYVEDELDFFQDLKPGVTALPAAEKTPTVEVAPPVVKAPAPEEAPAPIAAPSPEETPAEQRARARKKNRALKIAPATMSVPATEEAPTPVEATAEQKVVAPLLELPSQEEVSTSKAYNSALTALVIAIASFVMVLPLILFIGPLSALIEGKIAMKDIASSGSDKGMTMVYMAMLLGVAGLILAIAFWVVIAVLVFA